MVCDAGYGSLDSLSYQSNCNCKQSHYKKIKKNSHYQPTLELQLQLQTLKILHL